MIRKFPDFTDAKIIKAKLVEITTEANTKVPPDFIRTPDNMVSRGIIRFTSMDQKRAFKTWWINKGENPPTHKGRALKMGNNETWEEEGKDDQ